MKTRVLIVDDHPVTRAGVRSILEDNDNIEIIGEAVDGRDAVDQADATKPDVLVMDITMPHLSGIDAAKEIIGKHPDMKVIALSIHAGEKFVREMLDAGASGYLLKDEMPEELIKAIKAVVKGEMFLSTGVTKVALSKNIDENKTIDKRVLLSKLLRPPLMDDFVIRTKIIDELERNILKPLSIISAGAGFGKSVAVSQWLEQTNYLKAWITLDLEHNEFRTFLNYLAATIEKLFPGQLKVTRSYITVAILPPIQEIAKAVINELCNIEENFILVLDDYDKITDAKIHDLMDAWLDSHPTNVHLCLITRRDPPLKLKSLILSGHVTEIRSKELSFSGEEITDLFKRFRLEDVRGDVVDIIQIKTEGWIIALRLVAMILNDEGAIGEKLKSLDGGLKAINEYLMIEVLTNQPDNLKHALVRSSITDRFSELFLDEIILEKLDINGQEFILQLENSNLFISKLDTEGKWYRYHPLFQSLLKDQLKELYSQEEITKYQLQASAWFENYKFPEEYLNDDLVKDDIIRRDKIIENSGPIQKDKLNVFTKKEHEILNCIAEGMRNQEIAERLFNSEETIKKHINNMFQKMYVKNRLSLVNRAREKGIIE